MVQKDITFDRTNNISHLPSKQVTSSSRAGASSNGRLPVGLVDKDSSKVTHNVDDTKHKTISREHGQVRSVVVSGNGSASILSSFKESLVGDWVKVDGFAFGSVVCHSLIQEFVDLIAGVNLDVNDENHGDQHTV